MSAFDHPALGEIREVLGTVGWIPWERVEGETVVAIDIDRASEEIVRALQRRGYLQ